VDLNGDGLRDVVVGPNNTSLGNEVVPVAPVFLLNHGNGHLVDATQQLFIGKPPSIEWDREVLTADFNRDGRPDVFIADHGHVNDSDPSAGRAGAQQHLILSTADGHLVDATANLPQQLTFTHSAAVADVNGDGAPDIFENNLGCCSTGHVQAQLLLNDGSGHFTNAADHLHGILTDQYGNDHSFACAFADVNGDGVPDLVLGGSEAQDASQILLNDGHGNFTAAETLPASIGPAHNTFVIDMRPLDVNGDGAVDLLLAESLNDPYYQTSKIQVLINDGHGHFTDETTTWMPQQPQTSSWPERLLVEDVNDDGRPDLTIHFGGFPPTTQIAPTALYLNQGDTFKQIAAPRDGFDNFGAIGYVNGDGPHAFFSVEFHSLGNGVSTYYVDAQIVTLPAPTGVHAVRIASGVRVSWKRVAAATRYQVRRRGKLIATTSATSVIDRTPVERPTYTVRSVNATGASPDSAPVAP
jgi:FG-GAP-like repeat